MKRNKNIIIRVNETEREQLFPSFFLTEHTVRGCGWSGAFTLFIHVFTLCSYVFTWFYVVFIWFYAVLMWFYIVFMWVYVISYNFILVCIWFIWFWYDFIWFSCDLTWFYWCGQATSRHCDSHYLEPHSWHHHSPIICRAHDCPWGAFVVNPHAKVTTAFYMGLGKMDNVFGNSCSF